MRGDLPGSGTVKTGRCGKKRFTIGEPEIPEPSLDF
jgi:hypothetical protein